MSGGEGVLLSLLGSILTPAMPTGATAPPQGSVTIPFFTVESARDNSGYVSGKGRTLREKGRNGGYSDRVSRPALTPIPVSCVWEGLGSNPRELAGVLGYRD